MSQHFLVHNIPCKAIGVIQTDSKRWLSIISMSIVDPPTIDTKTVLAKWSCFLEPCPTLFSLIYWFLYFYSQAKRETVYITLNFAVDSLKRNGLRWTKFEWIRHIISFRRSSNDIYLHDQYSAVLSTITRINLELPLTKFIYFNSQLFDILPRKNNKSTIIPSMVKQGIYRIPFYIHSSSSSFKAFYFPLFSLFLLFFLLSFYWKWTKLSVASGGQQWKQLIMQHCAHYSRWQHLFTVPITILNGSTLAMWPHFIGGTDGVNFQ